MSTEGNGRVSPKGSSESHGEDRVWTVLDLLRWTTKHFSEQGLETPRLDAELLLAHALGLERLTLYLQFDKPVQSSERAAFRELIRRRVSERVPISLLLGEREFWSRSFRVTEDVLTPRPDTETLVEAALEVIRQASPRSFRVLDLGTGSGAIGISLAAECSEAQVTATDICPKALQIAQMNADELQVSENIRFLLGDLFGPIGTETFDLIVSNPPYLARSKAGGLAPELSHEPEQALFGGSDGYAVLRPFAAGVGERLEPGGWVGVEIDPGQADVVAGWFAEAGLCEIDILNDLAGRPRVVSARKKTAT